MENTTGAEAPLLASLIGIKYSAHERPSKILQGRASFKLKISQVKNLFWSTMLYFFFSLLIYNSSVRILIPYSSWPVTPSFVSMVIMLFFIIQF